jgi:hypothetical protein
MPSVTITLPAPLVGELPEFAAVVASFDAVLDQIGASSRPVPRRLVAALDGQRETLIRLGELRMMAAVVRGA